MGSLDGRRTVVTGGARGLGRAIAGRLAAEGAAVTVIDLEAALAEAPLPGGWHGIAADLGDRSAEAALAPLAAEPLDILVANAGVVPAWARIGALDWEEWDRVFAVNVRGVALTLKAFAPALARSAAGSAILMASINGYRAHAEQALYTATKHAVVGLMRAAALDLGRDGVRVNALAPGPVATAALRERVRRRAAAGGAAPEAALAALAAETALGSIATEEMVAEAALWLAGDGSAGVTGTVLPVERGLG